MSRQFIATRIFYTISQATSVDHDGEPYINDEFPVGTLLCVDALGDVFAGTAPWMKEPEAHERSAWHVKPNGAVLFRDYWRFVATAHDWAKPDNKLSPYVRAVRNATTKDIYVK